MDDDTHEDNQREGHEDGERRYVDDMVPGYDVAAVGVRRLGRHHSDKHSLDEEVVEDQDKDSST